MPAHVARAGDLAPKPRSNRHVTSTPKAAISGPHTKYVRAAAVIGM